MVKAVLEPVSIGILIAIVWGAFSYAIAKAKNGEDFEPQKFAKTLLIGIILASMAQGLGYDITKLEGMSLTTVLTIFVDKLTGLLLKKGK